MNSTVRAFVPSPSEYKAITHLHNVAWPERNKTIQQWQNEDNTWENGYYRQHFVAEIDGDIVGFATVYEWAPAHIPGMFEFIICVHPKRQRQGVGSALYEYIVAITSARSLTGLRSFTNENKAESVRFLQKRQFEPIMREYVSLLDVRDFEPNRYAGLDETMTAMGIELSPLSSLQGLHDDWLHRIYDLEWDLSQDIPSPAPFTRQPLEEFAKVRFGGPWFDPDAWTIARYEEEWIGMNVIWLAEGESEKVFGGMTAVRRDFRRQGVATILKLRGIEYARRLGFKYIQVTNEENNPMFDLNLKLGFTPQPALVWYEKTVSD